MDKAKMADNAKLMTDEELLDTFERVARKEYFKSDDMDKAVLSVARAEILARMSR